jgi:hypothetical protein
VDVYVRIREYEVHRDEVDRLFLRRPRHPVGRADGAGAAARRGDGPRDVGRSMFAVDDAGGMTA